MRCLYLDNFRGFSDVLIPLVDVNFLVGENSTGKTSLLMMFKMLSRVQVYGPESVAHDEAHIGHFEEIVSVHSKDKTYFRLGYAAESGSKSKKVGVGILLTYENIEGLARISRLSTIAGKSVLHLFFQGKKALFKRDETANLDGPDAVANVLRQWAKIHKSPLDESWTEIKPLPDDIRSVTLVFLVALAQTGGNVANQITFNLPDAAPQLVWTAPIRSKPRRTYDEPQTPYSPEGSHTPYVIRRMLSSEKDAKKFREFIEQVGEASGLFEKIEIKRFGDSEVSPFEVDAYLDDIALGIGWVGYGVSQSLPIFVELLDRPTGSWFAIQQPEVHLHPRAQACLGDVFFEMASRDNKRFLIETHSDFAIDRFRLNYRRRRSKRDSKNIPSSQILFFERKNKKNVVTSLPIGSKGELPEDQPESYRSFFIREEMKMLGI